MVTAYRLWLPANPTTVALTLLLLILLVAANWGLRYAVALSLAATACYNFYFLPPIGTFTIADPQDWVALLAFLATAVIASRLSVRIREETLDARTRQGETAMLLELSRELLQTDKVTELVEAIPASVALVLHAPTVVLYLTHTAEEGGRVYQTVESEETPEDLRSFAMLPTATRLEGERVAVPLRVGVKPRGVLLLEGAVLSTETFEAMGGLVSIAIDRAQALEEVTRSEAAKESERLRSFMLDSITHELRTPLTSIKAAVTMLLSAGEISPPDRHELLTVVDEESDRLNQLVAQAVEMARLETHEVHMHFEPLSVRTLLREALAACGGAMVGRDCSLDVPEALPPVVADREWARKVLCNLLENAAKYSPAGTPVELSARRHGDAVSISVRDWGVGIAASEQALIFDKFYRVPSQVERVPGTGMGLASCRAILEAHGSTLTVASELGRGSTFTFALPVSSPAR